MSDFNEQIISEFHANDGTVETAGFGRSLVLVHNIGAKSGQERISPLAGMPDGDDAWLIAASAAGAPDHPAWYTNLLKTPDVDIEVPTDDGIRTVPVTVTDLAGAERDAAWKRFTDRSAVFADYEGKAAPRVIPILRLSRR